MGRVVALGGMVRAMLARLGEVFSRWAERWVPDPFVLALVLTLITLARRVCALRVRRRSAPGLVRRIFEHAAARFCAADVPDPRDRSGAGVEPAGATTRPRGCALAQANPGRRRLGRAHRVHDRSHSMGSRRGRRGVRGARDRPQRRRGRAADGHPCARRCGIHRPRGLAWGPQRLRAIEGSRVRAVHPGRDAGDRRRAKPSSPRSTARQRRLAHPASADVHRTRAEGGLGARVPPRQASRRRREAIVARTSRRRRGDAARPVELVPRRRRIQPQLGEPVLLGAGAGRAWLDPQLPRFGIRRGTRRRRDHRPVPALLRHPRRHAGERNDRAALVRDDVRRVHYDLPLADLPQRRPRELLRALGRRPVGASERRPIDDGSHARPRLRSHHHGLCLRRRVDQPAAAVLGTAAPRDHRPQSPPDRRLHGSPRHRNGPLRRPVLLLFG